MELIKNQEFGGERPLYARHGLRLEDVTVHAGESALKETSDIECVRCRFEGKYPLWCCDRFAVRDCLFTEGARAALWYSSSLQMSDTLVEAPKMFREMKDLSLKNVRIPNAAETLWGCADVRLEDVHIQKGDYLLMHSRGIKAVRLHLDGNYSFQYCRDVEIHDLSLIHI